MELAFSILLAAMNLLTAVQTTPNITPEFRQYAMTVAQNAIVFAQAKIASSTEVGASGISTLSPVIPSVGAPSFGSTNQAPTQATPEILPTQIKLSNNSVDVIGGGCSGVTESATVFYSGTAPDTDTLTVTYPNGKIDTVDSRNQGLNNWLQFNINYVPKIQSGNEVVTVSKNTLSKTITLNVIAPDFSVDNPSTSHQIFFNGGRPDGLNYNSHGGYFSTTTNQCY